MSDFSSNPFSTRRVRPGAIAYCFPEGVDVETLLARLHENGWRGEIVGPHGSGKSALLATLMPAIEQRARASRPSSCTTANGGCPWRRRECRDWTPRRCSRSTGSSN